MPKENQCPDRDCHERVTSMSEWIWGKSKSNGANKDIRKIEEELKCKLTWRWSVAIPLIVFIVVPVVVWAWDVSVELDKRVTRLEEQSKKIERIDKNIQTVLERLPEGDG